MNENHVPNHPLIAPPSPLNPRQHVSPTVFPRFRNKAKEKSSSILGRTKRRLESMFNVGGEGFGYSALTSVRPSVLNRTVVDLVFP